MELSQPIQIRVFPEDHQKIKEYVEAFPEKYESESHFIRCAIQYYLREGCRKDLKV